MSCLSSLIEEEGCGLSIQVSNHPRPGGLLSKRQRNVRRKTMWCARVRGTIPLVGKRGSVTANVGPPTVGLVFRSACCNDYNHVCDAGRDCCLTGCCNYGEKCCGTACCGATNECCVGRNGGKGGCCDAGNQCCPGANGGSGGCCRPGQICCGSACCNPDSQSCSGSGGCVNRVTPTKAQVTVTVQPGATKQTGSASALRGCGSIALAVIPLGVVGFGLQ